MAKTEQRLEYEEKVGERVGARTYQEMIGLALRKQLEGQSLNEKEVRVLVDCLAAEDRGAKALTERVNAGKPVLLNYAREKGLHLLDGDESFANVGDKTSFDLPASRAIELLKKEGKLKLLDEILSVQVIKFRQYLGSDLFEKFASKEEKQYASIAFKKK